MSDKRASMDVKFDTRALDKLRAAFKVSPTAQVGVLGTKNSRDNQAKGGTDAQTNAEIGAVHEYGAVVDRGGIKIRMPIRSFLRMPITEKLSDELGKLGAFTEETLRRVIREKSIKAWVEKVGATAFAVVMEAFDTGGFGKWKPSKMEHKTNQQTLVETRQLRDSITWEVKP
jgi:phage gpG-like protein